MTEKINIGDRISRYNLKSVIHTSEFIQEYEAIDDKLEREVTLKLINHSLQYSKESVDYFLHEAKVLSLLDHPNISKVLDFGIDSGYIFLVSEKAKGIDLATWADIQHDWREAVTLVQQIADAMAYAHEKGIIHRDLKPENIVLNDNGQPILHDFSLVRIIEDEETKDLTGTHVGLGSPEYISPEQGKGYGADYRSDIYSLGVILFELTTGQKPFIADNSMEYVIQHVTIAPPDPQKINSNIPKKLSKIILKALEKDVGDRFQSMNELKQALEPFVIRITRDHKKKSIKKTKIIFSLVIFFLLIIFARIFIKPFDPQPISSISEDKEPTILIVESIEPKQANNILATELFTAKEPNIVNPSQKISTPVSTTDKLNKNPILENTKLPETFEISSSNLTELSEIARWGMPKIEKLFWVKDNQLIIAITGAGIYFLDAKTLNISHFYSTDKWFINGDVSNDEKFIITTDKYGNIYIIDIMTGETITTFEGNGKSITSIDLSDDNKRFVSSDEDRTIRIFDLENQVQLSSLVGHSHRINRIKFLIDQHSFITVADDYKINIWNEDGQLIKVISANQKIRDFDITSDNRYIVLALSNSIIQVIELETGRTINNFSEPKITTSVDSVKILPNDSLFLSSYENGRVILWNLQGNEKIWEIPLTNEEGVKIELTPINHINLSNDGIKFVYQKKNGQVEIWNLTSQKLVLSRNFNINQIKKLFISKNDNFLAVQMGEDSVGIWKLPESKKLFNLNNSRLPNSEPFSFDEKKILVFGNTDLEIYSLDSGTIGLIGKFHGLSPNNPLTFLNNQLMVAGYNSFSGNLLLWSLGSMRELEPEITKSEGSCKIITTRSNEFLTGGSNVGIVSELSFYKEFCKIIKPDKTLSQTVYVDGGMTAFGLEGQAIEIWFSNQGNQKYILNTPDSGKILGVAFSHDGKLLAAASEFGKIYLFNLKTNELISSFQAHNDLVTSIVFSNNGRFLISGSADGTVKFWGIAD